MRTLYECEVGGSVLEEALAEAARSADLNEELTNYSSLLVHGVADHQEEIDDELNDLIVKYDLMRLAALDRNILRIGAYEIAYVNYIPPKVSINEAIEIAKKYSTAESHRFINGVLGKFMRKDGRSEFVEEAFEEEATEPEQAEVEVLEEDSKEADEVRKLGLWKIRAESTPSE